MDGIEPPQQLKGTKMGMDDKEETDTIPEEKTAPIKAQVQWEVNTGAQRTLERKRVPTKRYEIDLLKISQHSDECMKNIPKNCYTIQDVIYVTVP